MPSDEQPAAPVRHILLALNGQPHTEAAIEWALRLARTSGASVTALHVKDPYLKQFYNEIYAQGRQAYLDHIDRCLADGAEEALTDFARRAAAAAVEYRPLIRAGDPLEEIVAACADGDHDLLVIGGRPVAVGRRPLRDLATRLAGSGGIPPLVVVRSP
ncbi:MAG: universal stress protein [Nitrospirota bacterium]|jgi:nucleotide-binding universal stress UspA family protein